MKHRRAPAEPSLQDAESAYPVRRPATPRPERADRVAGRGRVAPGGRERLRLRRRELPCGARRSPRGARPRDRARGAEPRDAHRARSPGGRAARRASRPARGDRPLRRRARRPGRAPARGDRLVARGRAARGGPAPRRPAAPVGDPGCGDGCPEARLRLLGTWLAMVGDGARDPPAGAGVPREARGVRRGDPPARGLVGARGADVRAASLPPGRGGRRPAAAVRGPGGPGRALALVGDRAVRGDRAQRGRGERRAHRRVPRPAGRGARDLRAEPPDPRARIGARTAGGRGALRGAAPGDRGPDPRTALDRGHQRPHDHRGRRRSGGDPRADGAALRARGALPAPGHRLRLAHEAPRLPPGPAGRGAGRPAGAPSGDPDDVDRDGVAPRQRARGCRVLGLERAAARSVLARHGGARAARSRHLHRARGPSRPRAPDEGSARARGRLRPRAPIVPPGGGGPGAARERGGPPRVRRAAPMACPLRPSGRAAVRRGGRRALGSGPVAGPSLHAVGARRDGAVRARRGHPRADRAEHRSHRGPLLHEQRPAQPSRHAPRHALPERRGALRAAALVPGGPRDPPGAPPPPPPGGVRVSGPRRSVVADGPGAPAGRAGVPALDRRVRRGAAGAHRLVAARGARARRGDVSHPGDRPRTARDVRDPGRPRRAVEVVGHRARRHRGSQHGRGGGRARGRRALARGRRPRHPSPQSPDEAGQRQGRDGRRRAVGRGGAARDRRRSGAPVGRGEQQRPCLRPVGGSRRAGEGAREPRPPGGVPPAAARRCRVAQPPDGAAAGRAARPARRARAARERDPDVLQRDRAAVRRRDARRRVLGPQPARSVPVRRHDRPDGGQRLHEVRGDRPPPDPGRRDRRHAEGGRQGARRPALLEARRRRARRHARIAGGALRAKLLPRVAQAPPPRRALRLAAHLSVAGGAVLAAAGGGPARGEARRATLRVVAPPAAVVVRAAGRRGGPDARRDSGSSTTASTPIPISPTTSCRAR